MVDHFIGNSTTSLGYHGFIYLAVLVHTRVVSDGICSLANTVRTAVPLGRQLLLARATNKGAVSIALPVVFPDITGRLCVRSSLTFVCCHLTSDKKREPRIADRNANAAEMIAVLGLRTAVRGARALVGSVFKDGAGWAAGASIEAPPLDDDASIRSREQIKGSRKDGIDAIHVGSNSNGEATPPPLPSDGGTGLDAGHRDRSVSEWPMGAPGDRRSRRLSAGDAAWTSSSGTGASMPRPTVVFHAPRNSIGLN